ncbi:MAG: hypothetical protein HYR86_06145 [Candidatus Rokubacteria bacterium]|nr:hypothetical protein [Candidatus Rokubacteria bacterium]
MRRLGHIACAAMVLILLALTASASAEERMKHSGSIISIADDARTFVLAEIGPWQVRDGATVITYRTITLAPETEFAIVARADQAPSGFPGDFVETPLGPAGVYLNDHVTVDCRHEGKRQVALKITVIELPAADIGILR